MSQDLYRIEAGPIYIKTRYCFEYVYDDRARLTLARLGGTLVFSQGARCEVERLLREYTPE